MSGVRDFKPLFLAACCAILLSAAAGAETPADAPETAVTLVAPEPVRAFLAKHLELPARMAGEDALATASVLLGLRGMELLRLLGVELLRLLGVGVAS